MGHSRRFYMIHIKVWLSDVNKIDITVINNIFLTHIVLFKLSYIGPTCIYISWKFHAKKLMSQVPSLNHIPKYDLHESSSKSICWLSGGVSWNCLVTHFEDMWFFIIIAAIEVAPLYPSFSLPKWLNILFFTAGISWLNFYAFPMLSPSG